MTPRRCGREWGKGFWVERVRVVSVVSAGDGITAVAVVSQAEAVVSPQVLVVDNC